MKKKTQTSNRNRLDPRGTHASGTTDWVRLWIEMLFVSSLVAIPSAFHYATSHSIVVKDSLALFYSLHFVLLGGALLIRERFWTKIPPSFLFPLFLYVLYGTVRCLQSPYWEHSWTQWSLTLAGLSAAIPAWILFQRKNSARRVLWTLAGVAFAVSVYSGFQFAASLTGLKGIDPINWGWNDVPLVGDFLRFAETDMGRMQWERFEGLGTLPGVCSTLGNPNFLAGFLIPLLGVFLAFGIGGFFDLDERTRPFPPRWTCLAATLVFGLSLVFAGSRGAVFGIAGVGLAIAFFAGREFRSRGRNRLGASLLALGIVIAIAAPSAAVALFWPTNAERAETVVGSVENRSLVYLCTSWLIRDNFWFGVGPGVFTIRFPEYMTGPEAEKYGWMEAPEEKVLEHAHSEFLEVWADLGLVGFAFWLTALLAWLRFVWRGWKDSPDAGSRWLLAGLTAGVLGTLFQDAISVGLRWIPVAWIFWTLIGAGAGWAARGTSARDDAPRPLPIWATLVCGVCALLLFVPSAKRFTADWYFVKGRDLVSVLSPEAETAFLRSIELNPRYPQSYYLLAGYYYSQSRFDEAIEYYNEVLRIRGEVVVLTENLATTYFKLSTTLERDADRQEALLSAIELYEASLARHPTFPRLYDYLARAYQRIGMERLAVEHRRRAIELYEKWFTWEYRYGRARYALDLGKCYLLEGEHEKAFWQARNAKRWGENPGSLEVLKRAIFEADPSLADRWDREDRKEAAANEPSLPVTDR